MNIPLPAGLKGHRDDPERFESIVNLYSQEGSLYRMAGVDTFTMGVGGCRGAFTFNSTAYMVSGGSLISIDQNGAIATIGAVTGTNDCEFAKDFARSVVLSKGGSAYELLPNGTLTQITTNYVVSDDVESMNGRFIFWPSDGSPLFYTDTNTTTIQPASFFDAELLPDKNTGGIVINNYLYAGGEESIEVFRDTGNANSPYARVDGAAMQTGYIGGKALIGNTFAFLGRDRESTPAFHEAGQGIAPKISNEAVDEILAGYSEAELKAVTSQRFTWNKTDFICWRLARHSLLYWGEWAIMQSGNTPAPWRVNHLTSAYGEYICGDAASAQIGKLADVLTEFTAPIRKEFTTFAALEKDAYGIVSSIEIDCLTGTSKTGKTDRLGLEVSKDGEQWFGPSWRELGNTGNRRQKIEWSGGVGQFESFLGMRFSTTGDINFMTRGLKVD